MRLVTRTACTVPAALMALSRVAAMAQDSFSRLGGIVQTASGHARSGSLARDGTLGCWGRNEFGQLGNGEPGTLPQTAPVPVRGMPEGARFVAAGLAHRCTVGA